MIFQASDGFARSIPVALVGLTPRRPASRPAPSAGVAQERSALPEVGLPSSPQTIEYHVLIEEVAVPRHTSESEPDGDRDRSAQGVVDRGSGGLRAAAAGHDPGAGQPGGLPQPAPVRRPVARRRVGDRGCRRAGRTADHAGWPPTGSPRWTCRPSSPPESGCCPPGTAARTTTPMRPRSAIAALTAAGLRTVAVDEAITVLRALVEHRDDVVKTRTQTVNRLHVLLTQLLPGGAPRELTPTPPRSCCARPTPRRPRPRTLRRLAAELVAEIRHLDRRIATANTQITAAVAASGSTLTELRGIGDLTAGKILARVGDIAPVPLRGGVRLLHRHRPHRGVLRRRRAPPALPRRGPPAQLLPAHHGHHPDPPRRPRPSLLPAQTSRREEPQRSPALSEAATVRRRSTAT